MQGQFWPSGHSHEVLDWCLERCSCFESLLARQMPSERRGEIITPPGKAITLARYDVGTHAINHNAATGERGYHNTEPVSNVIRKRAI